MTTRLKIASRLLPGLVMQDMALAIEKPEAVAYRALLLAEALLQCDSLSEPAKRHFDRHDSSLVCRIASRRKLLLPDQEMMRPVPDATRH